MDVYVCLVIERFVRVKSDHRCVWLLRLEWTMPSTHTSVGTLPVKPGPKSATNEISKRERSVNAPYSVGMVPVYSVLKDQSIEVVAVGRVVGRGVASPRVE